MTTYGTIQTTPIASSNLEFFSRTRDRIHAGIGTRRPWTEVISRRSISLPAGAAEAFRRVRTNAGYFRVNYAMAVLFVLFLSLLWHPISLVVFVIAMAAWLFFYFLRDEPLAVFGWSIDDRIVLIALSVVTVTLLFLTSATANILAALGVGAAAVGVHGALRRTDDLDMDDEEDGGAGSGVTWRRISLKETASSSFSSS